MLRKGIDSVSHGETIRILYTRLTEHAKDLHEKHEENPLYEHMETSHENESVKFDYVPHKFFSDPDRKSTRLNSSHANISYAVFCLKKKKKE